MRNCGVILCTLKHKTDEDIYQADIDVYGQLSMKATRQFVARSI